MLNTLSQITGAKIAATDGDIGRTVSAFFDDQSWTIRYLVVDTGSWLSDRSVLISPYAVKKPLSEPKTIHVALTRDQVKRSPDVDTHQPVSRRYEREYLAHYAYPEYWTGGGLWAMGSMPLLPDQPFVSGAGTRPITPEDHSPVPPEDVHLRSSVKVAGYDIQATDGSIGHVKDFVFDEDSWAIRYLLVDTHNWWPGGRKVLIGTHWVDRIDWAQRKVYARLTREQVKDSPAYDELKPIQREYEQRLHDVFGRPGYWD